MPRGVPISPNEKLYNNLKELDEKGFDIDLMAMKVIEIEVKKEKGLVALWVCPNVKCLDSIEMYTQCSGISCKCGRQMKRSPLTP